VKVTGWGYDVHRFNDRPPLLLAGVVADASRGVDATSDGDVVAHAVADAFLGAASLGDLGEFFPPSDPRWEGADSMELLDSIRTACEDTGLQVEHLDVTIIAETVRIAPIREWVRTNLAHAMQLPVDAVSVKATSTDGLGFVGRDEGIAVVAVVSGTR
jgi:2-C-methyl-D-erythritol 2,4-cyclodiphosphate synthase